MNTRNTERKLHLKLHKGNRKILTSIIELEVKFLIMNIASSPLFTLYNNLPYALQENVIRSHTQYFHSFLS